MLCLVLTYVRPRTCVRTMPSIARWSCMRACVRGSTATSRSNAPNSTECPTARHRQTSVFVEGVRGHTAYIACLRPCQEVPAGDSAPWGRTASSFQPQVTCHDEATGDCQAAYQLTGCGVACRHVARGANLGSPKTSKTCAVASESSCPQLWFHVPGVRRYALITVELRIHTTRALPVHGLRLRRHGIHCTWNLKCSSIPGSVQLRRDSFYDWPGIVSQVQCRQRIWYCSRYQMFDIKIFGDSSGVLGATSRPNQPAVVLGTATCGASCALCGASRQGTEWSCLALLAGITTEAWPLWRCARASRYGSRWNYTVGSRKSCKLLAGAAPAPRTKIMPSTSLKNLLRRVLLGLKPVRPAPLPSARLCVR